MLPIKLCSRKLPPGHPSSFLLIWYPAYVNILLMDWCYSVSKSSGRLCFKASMLILAEHLLENRLYMCISEHWCEHVRGIRLVMHSRISPAFVLCGALSRIIICFLSYCSFATIESRELCFKEKNIKASIERSIASSQLNANLQQCIIISTLYNIVYSQCGATWINHNSMIW